MKDWIDQHQVTEIECSIPDFAGAARGKISPASKFTDNSELRLPQSIFPQSVTSEYPDIFDMCNNHIL